MQACPKCGGPMKPLFIGSFCPRDCDRPAGPTPAVSGDVAYRFVCGGKSYRVFRVETGGRFPSGTTYGWHLNGSGLMREDSRLPMDELLAELAKHRTHPGARPGWLVDAGNRGITMPCPTLAFIPND